MPSTPEMATTMAAMMLPGAPPAIARGARANRSPLAAPRFAVSYVVVWFAAGLAIFAIYEPPRAGGHGGGDRGRCPLRAAPFARACWQRCRAELRSGLRFGRWCVGSSLGLTAAFVALDPMSLPLMCAAGAIALIHKELLS